MVGAVEHLILLLMARTNHTFPSYRGGGGNSKESGISSIKGGSLNLGGEVGVFGERSWSIWGKLYPAAPTG